MLGYMHQITDMKENVKEEIGGVRGLMGDLWLFVGLQHLKISFRKDKTVAGDFQLW